MKCELFKIKNGEICETCNGFFIAKINDDIILIKSGTFKKFSPLNIFKKETTCNQQESPDNIEPEENLISAQESLEIINSLQKEMLQLKEEHKNQIVALKEECSESAKQLNDYTSDIAGLEIARDRLSAHISKLEDDHIKAIGERNECRNKLDETTEILQRTEKEKKELEQQYALYSKRAEEKRSIIRKQRDEYKDLIDEMIKDKKNLEKMEKLKSKKTEPPDNLLELENIKGSLESIVEEIFLESPDMTNKQAIALLKKVKSPVNNKKRWRASTIQNRVNNYLKKRDEIKQHIKKPPYNINHKTNRWGESILHDQHTQDIYNKYHVYLTIVGVKALTNVLSERCSEVLTARSMHDLILSTLSKKGIKVGKHTYRGYLLYFVLSKRLISSGKGNSFKYTIMDFKNEIEINSVDGKEISRHGWIIQNGWLNPPDVETKKLIEEAKDCSEQRLKEIDDYLLRKINLNISNKNKNCDAWKSLQ